MKTTTKTGKQRAERIIEQVGEDELIAMMMRVAASTEFDPKSSAFNAAFDAELKEMLSR